MNIQNTPIHPHQHQQHNPPKNRQTNKVSHSHHDAYKNLRIYQNKTLVEPTADVFIQLPVVCFTYENSVPVCRFNQSKKKLPAITRNSSPADYGTSLVRAALIHKKADQAPPRHHMVGRVEVEAPEDTYIHMIGVGTWRVKKNRRGHGENKRGRRHRQKKGGRGRVVHRKKDGRMLS